ncbi:type ISP restriction/modification enzyme [Streptomyces sudanensis]
MQRVNADVPLDDVSPDAPFGDAPLLDDLMPWSAPPPRLGREWVTAPDAGTLRARWDALLAAGGAEREALFRPSRARTPRSAVAALPGQRTGTVRLAREDGPCPEPVRVAYGPFDERWLLPDHRLIDAARPELWRVADERQVFAVEQGYVPGAAGPALLVTAPLPTGRSPAGRPGRIRPLYRRPGGREPNAAPGLAALLREHHGREPSAGDLLAWAAAVPSPAGCRVPLARDPEVWAAGVALGRRMVSVHLRGARGGERPRLPGGRRPYVRAALPPWPRTLEYDAGSEVLHVDAGRIAPVPAEAWDYRVGGVRVLPLWFERRTADAEPGTLEAIRPPAWPPAWTSELLELITVLALLGALDGERDALAERLRPVGAALTRADLYGARILPHPPSARRPASVLDHREEGPEGQFALL